MAVTEIALDDGRLGHHLEQGALEHGGGTNRIEDPADVVPAGLQLDNELPNDRVKTTLKIHEERQSADTVGAGGGKETTHTQGGKPVPLPRKPPHWESKKTAPSKVIRRPRRNL